MAVVELFSLTTSVELRKAYARVVRLQNLLVGESRARESVGSDLTEADAVAEAAPLKREARDASAVVEGALDDEQKLRQIERGVYASAANVGGALRADEFQINHAARHAATAHAQVE